MLRIDAAAYRSPWRRLHPAVKATFCGGLAVCALALPPWPGAAITALVVLVAAFGPARVAPRTFARSARAPLLFILTGAATLLVSVGGPEGLVAWAPGGWQRAAEISGRAAAALSCQLLFAFTTPLAEVLPRLVRLGLPPALVEVTSLIYRMLFVILDTAHRVHTAQAGRLGHETWRSWIRSVGSLGAAIFVRSFDRARRMQQGLAGRGYTGDLTVLVDATPLRAASVAVAALPPLLVAAIALTWRMMG
ncbi:cobalt ECF transporter T component CbiQ [Salinactinospora qingdaonensis]|uniref:Cobalt ECF transporter T component CbiQ n=1 Tax=Salinactinospora qingdaonensis TaxID=702744 RepID=A0ABP7EW89_9ACTN